MTECVPDTELRFPCVTKIPGETFPVILSVFGMCAQFWESNEQWETGEFAWPTKANGFVAEWTSPSGRSSLKEPRWPTDEGANATIPDGSGVWTLRVPTILNGIQPVSNPSATAPAGITASGVIVIENTKIAVDYIGGTAGESYNVDFTWLIAGRPRGGRQVVHVVDK